MLAVKLNPYSEVAKRPSKPVAAEEPTLSLATVRYWCRNVDRVSKVMSKIHDADKTGIHSTRLRQYAIWASGAIRKFITDECVWDAVELLDKWVKDSSTVSQAELEVVREAVKQLRGRSYSSLLLSSCYYATTVWAIADLLNFERPAHQAMGGIEMAYKNYISCTKDVSSAYNTFKLADKLYQTAGYQERLTRSAERDAAYDTLNHLVNSKMSAVVDVQFDMFHSMVVDYIQDCNTLK